MKILDLFAGIGGELRRKEIEALGHEYVTVDINPSFGCSITDDIFNIDAMPGFDLIWASPPCEGFSVARIGDNWYGPDNPKSDKAKLGIRIVAHTLEIINNSNPGAWLLENPRGMLRTIRLMKRYPRSTVTYCKYGDFRMKPTDLWGFVPNWTPRLPCKSGDKCHEAASRGENTGTQGLSNSEDRAVVPLELWLEIINSYDGRIDTSMNNPQLSFGFYDDTAKNTARKLYTAPGCPCVSVYPSL